MVDTNGIVFGSWILDAREVIPLNTRLRLARLFEANTSMVQQNLHKNILQAL